MIEQQQQHEQQLSGVARLHVSAAVADAHGGQLDLQLRRRRLCPLLSVDVQDGPPCCQGWQGEQQLPVAGDAMM